MANWSGSSAQRRAVTMTCTAKPSPVLAIRRTASAKPGTAWANCSQPSTTRNRSPCSSGGNTPRRHSSRYWLSLVIGTVRNSRSRAWMVASTRASSPATSRGWAGPSTVRTCGWSASALNRPAESRQWKAISPVGRLNANPASRVCSRVVLPE